MKSNYKELLSIIDIVTVISKYIKLEQKGNNYWGICPFHLDKNPSLSVSRLKNIFKCFSCNIVGDAVFFVMKHQKLLWKPALIKICQDLNLDIANYNLSLTSNDFQSNQIIILNEFISEIFQRTLFDETHHSALEYLKNIRKISPELIKEFSLGLALPTNQLNLIDLIQEYPHLLQKKTTFSIKDLVEASLIKENKNTWNNFFQDQIIFPILNQQQNIVGFSGRHWKENNFSNKYINIAENSLFKKRELLYGLDKLQVFQNKQLYLTEGFFDVIALYSLKKTALGTMGINLSNYHLKIINNFCQNNQINQIILAFDQDEAGKALTIQVAKLLISHNYELFVVFKTEDNWKDLAEAIFELNITDNVLNPIPYFEWYCETFLAKNNAITLTQIKEIITEQLNLICTIKNKYITWNRNINAELTLNALDNLYGLYKKITDKEIQLLGQQEHQKYKKSFLNQSFNLDNNLSFTTQNKDPLISKDLTSETMQHVKEKSLNNDQIIHNIELSKYWPLFDYLLNQRDLLKDFLYHPSLTFALNQINMTEHNLCLLMQIFHKLQLSPKPKKELLNYLDIKEHCQDLKIPLTIEEFDFLAKHQVFFQNFITNSKKNLNEYIHLNFSLKLNLLNKLQKLTQAAFEKFSVKTKESHNFFDYMNHFHEQIENLNKQNYKIFREINLKKN